MNRMSRYGGKAETLEIVADAYTRAESAGERAPRVAVAEELGYTPGHMDRLLRECRKAGLIPAYAGPQGRYGVPA